MRLYWYGLLMILQKLLLRRNTGRVVCDFVERMGVVYIKVAQILAMQNLGDLFTESDRQNLSRICDHCNPIKFSRIEKILQAEYGADYSRHFRNVDQTPLGSASISQVHRATLADGREVVLKIKRRDVTRRVQKDIRQIRRLIHRFGRFAKFRNFFGSDRALECYIDWIMEETDFCKEQQNILRYQEFANSVNDKIPRIQTRIVVPGLIADLCTENIIVMEYVSQPTISQLPLTNANKNRISQAENDYIELSFYALFHGLPVVFHGDPHGGNIYLDADDNFGFLDLGLIFEFSAEEAVLTRELFLDAYTGKVEQIANLLFVHSQFKTVDRATLIADMEAKIGQLHSMPVPQFFVEMMMIFTQHDIAPPRFLFKMAKAFLALFGLNTIMENHVGAEKLLAHQITEFYFSRTVNDVRTIFNSGLQLAPNFLHTTLQEGIGQGLSQQFSQLTDFSQQCQTALQNCREVLDLFQIGVK